MKKINSMKNQGGFIGSLIFLVFIVGFVVVLFAGRVIYNNYQNQSEIFSFDAFGHTFQMTQQKSFKEKVKDELNKVIDGVAKGSKDVAEAVEDIAKERGVTDAVDDTAKAAKKGLGNAERVLEENVPSKDEAKKAAENVGESAVGAVTGFIKGVGKAVDDYKKENQ